MPWQGLVKLVEPFYPKSDQPGRPVKPLIWMLKLYFLQIWYGLSDPRTEELMHDSHAVQEFLGLDQSQLTSLREESRAPVAAVIDETACARETAVSGAASAGVERWRKSNAPAKRRSAMGQWWLAGCLMLAAFCLFRAAPRDNGSASPQPASVSVAASTRLLEEIEQVRLGQRVVTDLPPELVIQAVGPVEHRPWWDAEEVDAVTWREIRLRAAVDDGILDIELLRPRRWIEQVQARVGHQIHLSLPEQGFDGLAEVASIGPCPPLGEGDGQVVTGTFTRVRNGIIDLYVEGLSEPLGVTRNHLVWSEDRHDFVPAGDLQPGEQMRQLGGLRRVVRVSSRSAPERVFNLEVHADHVYRVTQAGLLVHNASTKQVDPSKLRLVDSTEENMLRVTEKLRRDIAKWGTEMSCHIPYLAKSTATG
ncbi:hypothetical protein JCM17478_35390 [Thermopirellula anaerolimosa]